MQAITHDDQNRLRWSRKGHSLALDIAKGLVHLHANKVCTVAGSLLCMLLWRQA